MNEFIIIYASGAALMFCHFSYRTRDTIPGSERGTMRSAAIIGWVAATVVAALGWPYLLTRIAIGIYRKRKS